jgi:hypothetical protein
MTKADVLKKAQELEVWKLHEEMHGQQLRPLDVGQRIEQQASLHVVRDCRRMAQEAYDEAFRAWADAGFPDGAIAR